MKFIFTISLTMAVFGLYAQNNRLKVQGNLKADTLSTLTLQLNGSDSTLIRGNNTPLYIGSGLSLNNTGLSANAGSINSRSIEINNSGNTFAIASPSTGNYTISLPYASASATGILRSNGRQTFANIKRFKDSLSIGNNGLLGFRDNTSNASSNLHWTIGSNANNDLVIQNLKTGNARLTLDQNGKLNILNPNSAGTAQLVSNTTVETRTTFKKLNADSTEAFYADGSVKKFSLYETRFRNLGGIMQDGNGILTNTPTALWEINGTGYQRNNIFKASSNYDVAMNINATENSYVGLTFQRNKIERAFLGLPGYKVPISNHLLIGADSVGIGTETPTAKLEVIGSISADGYKIPGGTSTQAMATDNSTIGFGGTLSVANGVISYTSAYLYSITEIANNGTVLNLTAAEDYVIVSGNVQPGISSSQINLPSPNTVPGKRYFIKNTSNGSMQVTIPNYMGSTVYITNGNTNITVSAGKYFIVFSIGDGYQLERTNT